MSISMSNKLKGIAIILMVIHHAFGFPNRIAEGLTYTSIFGDQIPYIIAVFGKICVSMFLILSGYGIAYCIKNREDYTPYKSIRTLYLNVFVIGIIFLPFVALLKDVDNVFAAVIYNITGLQSSLNGEWWFLLPYVFSILFFYFCSRITRNLVEILFIYGVILISWSQIYPIVDPMAQVYLFTRIDQFFTWFPCFMMGVFLFKIEFHRLRVNLIVAIIGIFALVIFRGFLFTSTAHDAIIGGVFIVLLVPLLQWNTIVHKLIEKCGKDSVYIWLLHSFFLYTIFQPIIYRLHFDGLIIAVTIALSLLVGSIIKKIVSYTEGKLKYWEL